MDTQIIFSDRQTMAIEVNRQGKVTIRAPQNASMKQISEFVAEHKDWIQKTTEKMIEREKAHPKKSEEEIKALILKAKKELPPKIEFYSKLMRVNPTHFSVTRATTRFGSCSSKNAISFSCFLMDYPDEAIDYVVVHELAHIKQHNHSKKFWAEVEKILPDRKEREKLLKK